MPRVVELTVDVGLECLAADLAREVRYAELLLHGHSDGLLVVAEETVKDGCQLLSLLLGHGLLGALAFALCICQSLRMKDMERRANLPLRTFGDVGSGELELRWKDGQRLRCLTLL